MAGCSSQANIDSAIPQDIIAKDDMKLYYDMNYDGIMHVYATDNGVYYKSTTNGSLAYFDESTQYKTILCNRVECIHADETCTAFFNNMSYGIFMNQKQDKLFVSYIIEQSVTEYTPAIWRIDMLDINGSNRKTVYERKEEVELGRQFAFEGNNMYFMVNAFNPETKAMECQLIELDYITGKDRIVDVFDTTLSIKAAYDNYLILDKAPTSYSSADEVVYSYDLLTEKLDILKENVGGYETGVFAKDNYLYIFERTSDTTAKVSQLDLITNESKIITESVTYFGTHSATLLGASFFDNYIVILSSLPPTDGSLNLINETYVVNINTGEVKKINLKSTNDYVFMYDTNKSVIVNTDFEDITSAVVDKKTGVKNFVTVYTPIHAVIEKEDYLNSINKKIYLEK